MLSFSCLCCKCMSRKILSLTADTRIHFFVEKNVVDKCSKVFTWPLFKAAFFQTEQPLFDFHVFQSVFLQKQHSWYNTLVHFCTGQKDEVTFPSGVQCFSWPSHLLIIKGAAGEAAEVLSRSQSCLCDGQVKSWSEPSGPHHWHDQLQGEERAKRLWWHDLMGVWRGWGGGEGGDFCTSYL